MTDDRSRERSDLQLDAQHAAERSDALLRVAAELSAAATAQDVLDVAIGLGLVTIGAAGGSIASPVRGTSSLHRVTAGYAPEDAHSVWATVPPDASLPGPQAARTGEPVWLEDRGEAERTFPLLREVFAHTPWSSLCALPLSIGERTGFFVAFFADNRRFDASSRRFIEAIVGLCGQALERADLLDAAERARDRARRLQAVTAALSAAATPDELDTVIAETGLRATDAESILVYVRHGETAKLTAHAGYDAELLAGWETIPSSAAVPVWHVLRTGTTLCFDGPEDARRRFPALGDSGLGRPQRPTVIAPVATAFVLGALCATYAVGRELGPEDVSFVETVGQLYGQALERSRLLESERTVGERLSRLQTITALLAGAMTVREVARIMVHEGVDALGGSAGALVVADGSGMLETVEAIGYTDEFLTTYQRFSPHDALAAARVFSRGEPRWVESLAEMESSYSTEEVALDPHRHADAWIPLTSGQRRLGVLLVSFDGTRRLSDDEKELLRTLGRQCAQALENARTYERQSRIAEELQQSLLPAELPPPDAIACAVRYLPGSAEADVGGDWYDFVALGEGRFGGGVGDVGGKGVLAAAQMGQLRTAQRAHTLEGLSPAAVIERLDALVGAGTEVFATVVAFDVDLATGMCRYASAGHPPPALLDSDGTVAFLEGARSLPLGASDAPRDVEATVHVRPDQVLFFYTDGLVERPTRSFDEGLERLVKSLTAHVGEAPARLVDAVIADLLPGDDRPDDVAVLALRPAPATIGRFTAQYPLEPNVLSDVRADVRRWLVSVPAPRDLVMDVVFATSEAASNAIEHAQSPARRSLDVNASVEGNDVVVVVKDWGAWREPNGDPDRGRGLQLIRAVVDDVRIDRGGSGTSVTLRRRLRHPIHG